MNNIISPEDISAFRNTINRFEEVSDEAFTQLSSTLQYRHFKKGEVIVREGQVCRHLFFIISGCIRSFSLEADKEVNVNFFFENEIVSDFYSLRHETPSAFFLVAMEDCKTFALAKADYFDIFKKSLSLTTLSFRFYQDMFFKEEEHSNSFKLMTPEERYQYVLNKQPHLLQRIPLTHLASYLGISRETISRIRRRIS